jgi:hypothetical protein
MGRVIGWVICVGLLLQGCGWPLVGAPPLEQAVAAAVRERAAQGPLLTPPEVRLSRRLRDQMVVLVTYTYAARETAVKYAALLVFQRVGGGWQLASWGGSGHSVAQPDPPIEFHGSCGSMAGESSLAEGYGLVADPAIQRVVVTFSDGSRQVGTVERGAYLVVQAGVACVTRIDALSGAGTILHTQVFASPAR